MSLSSKTLEELLDLARGEQFPTPLERELTARLGVLAAKLEAIEMVQGRPSRVAVFGKPPYISTSLSEAPDNFNPSPLSGHLRDYLENKP